jgi:hypothetical protein
MAMDVEYEEYSSTSSSKHHGWKLEVSRRHRETQEMEALEARIAAEYAKIDHGISVGDLTAPRATNLIKEMDRSARLPGAIANGPLNDHEGVVMFLTYPDREGLCGALPTLQTLEESERESRRDAAEDEKNARDAKEKKKRTLRGARRTKRPTPKDARVASGGRHAFSASCHTGSERRVRSATRTPRRRGGAERRRRRRRRRSL